MAGKQLPWQGLCAHKVLGWGACLLTVPAEAGHTGRQKEWPIVSKGFLGVFFYVVHSLLASLLPSLPWDISLPIPSFYFSNSPPPSSPLLLGPSLHSSPTSWSPIHQFLLLPLPHPHIGLQLSACLLSLTPFPCYWSQSLCLLLC